MIDNPEYIIRIIYRVRYEKREQGFLLAPFSGSTQRQRCAGSYSVTPSDADEGATVVPVISDTKSGAAHFDATPGRSISWLG
jgi:hypothetical protein